MEDFQKESCEGSSPNSSGSKDLGKTLPEEAFTIFLQGKQHMLVQDYSSAAENLAVACELYIKHFGELAIECGEVYFLYGKALFRLSQQQAGILGGAFNEDGEGKGEEMEPSQSTDSSPSAVNEGSSECKTKVESSEPSDNVSTSHKEESESEDNKKEAVNEENMEVEEDDLELAWNTLETAKSIFKRKDTVEYQLKVADILLLLAEISMESHNNANAISDLQECLEIQKKHLKNDNRILAETYYQMGLAMMLDKMYPEALENFHTTQDILQLCKEHLKSTPVNEADGTFQSADVKAEISDLERILVDIQEKIDGTEELICNKKKELEETSVDQAGVAKNERLNDVPGEDNTQEEEEEEDCLVTWCSDSVQVAKNERLNDVPGEDNTQEEEEEDCLMIWCSDDLQLNEETVPADGVCAIPKRESSGELIGGLAINSNADERVVPGLACEIENDELQHAAMDADSPSSSRRVRIPSYEEFEAACTAEQQFFESPEELPFEVKDTVKE